MTLFISVVQLTQLMKDFVSCKTITITNSTKTPTAETRNGSHPFIGLETIESSETSTTMTSTITTPEIQTTKSNHWLLSVSVVNVTNMFKSSSAVQSFKRITVRRFFWF